ncbi:MAG TPA: polymer-forming cytoskeletal protein [Rhodanobacteraceae bacterium]|nr:polymer-forming cytoskeletal protein [Rhodanobacteraceae bacterium]
MFHSKKEGTDGAVAETTIIARGVELEGDLRFTGSLFLEGCVRGSISADDEAGTALFTLSERGRVIGQIRVAHVVVDGSVQGDIHSSERLELAANARIEGDVHYNVLEMAAGARVTGRMIHEPDAPRQLTHVRQDAADAGPRYAPAADEAEAAHADVAEV